MDSTKGIGQVEPTHTEGLVFPPCFIDGGQKLEVVLCTPGDPVNKCLLHCGVQVSVVQHVLHPSLLEYTGEHLANA